MKKAKFILIAAVTAAVTALAGNDFITNDVSKPVPTTVTNTVSSPVPVVVAPMPGGGTPKTGTSGNVANASAVGTLPAVSGKTNYITGFQITASGATAALVVNATVTGLITGTATYTFVFPAGVTTTATPLTVNFDRPIPASATNTAITVTLPASGAGGTNASVNVQGFDL